MSQHTPGPWEIVKDDDHWRLRQKGSFKRRPGFTIERPVAEGFLYKLDAQLAAAAPGLLAALELAMKFIGPLKPTAQGIEAFNAARTAIARAKGESQ